MALKPLNSGYGFSVGVDSIINVIDVDGNVTANVLTVDTYANLGNVSNVSIGGGSNGYVLQTDGTGNLNWATVNQSGISNGSSNVNIPVINGNVDISVGGTANVLVVSAFGANISGTANVTGNITTTNIDVTGISNLGNVSNVNIAGGSNGFFLRTDGGGNLSFVAPASLQSPAPMPTYVPVGTDLTISANYQGLFSVPITVDGVLDIEGVLVEVDGIRGTSNNQVIFNNQGNITGNANLTFVTTYNMLTTHVVKTTPTTYSGLPTAASVGAGARAFITDGNTTTFMATVGGSGSNSIPIYSNGTNWLVG